MHPVIGVDTTVVVLLVAAAVCAVVLAVILVGPSRSVRDEPPMDPVTENRLLLGRDPEQPTGEMPRISLAEEPPAAGGDELSGLRDLDDEPRDGGRAG